MDNSYKMAIMFINSVEADGTILAQDSLGKDFAINGTNRPKGSGFPAVGEQWLADRSTGAWRLVSQYNAAPPPVITSIDVKALVVALASLGLVINNIP